MGNFSVRVCCVLEEIWDCCPRRCGTVAGAAGRAIAAQYSSTLAWRRGIKYKLEVLPYH